MCVVSMIGDSFRDRWEPITPITWPTYPSSPPTSAPNQDPNLHPNLLPSAIPPIQINGQPVTREEFEALRKEVDLMKDLLIRAKKYDEANGEPDCEIDEKVELLKKVAALFGVSLDEVFGKKNAQ